MRLTTSYDVRRPLFMAWVRFAAAAWLVVLVALLCWIRKWWGTVLLLPAGLVFWVGWRVLRSAQN
jgi:hypothetical protein